MVALLLVALAQPPCPADAATLMEEAAARVEAFDLPGAADRLEAALARGCEIARVGALYLRGLVDAGAAFRRGAPPESLAPVRSAIASLEQLSRNRPGRAEIARLMLQAAAAGAQSERDEMSVYLDAAVRMEALQRAAGQPGLPLVSAHEAAGDLWLQVFRYADARRSYMRAVEEGAPTLRVLAGLARTAARLGNEVTACTEYQSLIDRWGAREGTPPEIADARTYLDRPGCVATAR
jgi:hypothetical protein